MAQNRMKGLLEAETPPSRDELLLSLASRVQELESIMFHQGERLAVMEARPHQIVVNVAPAAIPPPAEVVVNVPEHRTEIINNVNVAPTPIENVNNVNVAPTPIENITNVNVPEVKAPDVHVVNNVPEVKAPEVHNIVNLPPAVPPIVRETKTARKMPDGSVVVETVRELDVPPVPDEEDEVLP